MALRLSAALPCCCGHADPESSLPPLTGAGQGVCTAAATWESHRASGTENPLNPLKMKPSTWSPSLPVPGDSPGTGLGSSGVSARGDVETGKTPPLWDNYENVIFRSISYKAFLGQQMANSYNFNPFLSSFWSSHHFPLPLYFLTKFAVFFLKNNV